MKKLYVVCFATLLGFLHCTAQGIYQFWGITDYGGVDGQGVLFSAKYDGTGVRSHNLFEITTPGARPEGNSMVYYNGRVYGAMPGAGELNSGIIYEYNPATNTYIKKTDFHRIGAYFPAGNLVVFQDRIYGVTAGGGNNSNGVIYEYDPATNGLTVKHYFEDGYGINPNAGLTVYNNKLYGTTLSGGIAGGVIFSYDPVNNVYAKLAELDYTLGFSVQSPLLAYNNRLFGVASAGGLNGQGTLFEFNPATNILVKRADMSTIGAKMAEAGLVQCNNKLYGGTWEGGANNMGVIYEYDPVQYALTKKIDLTEANGQKINAEMVLYNNKLYGLTTLGGSSGDGTLFEYDPVTNTYQKKVNFSEQSMGGNPYTTMLVVNDKFYSVTYSGGLNGFGALFEYSPGFNGFAKKIDLMSSDGYYPRGKLTYYSGKLYGVTAYGGVNNKGVIYSYDLATGAYAVRHHMSAATGYVVGEGGMLLYNNKLYGVTRDDEEGEGVLYEFDPLTDNYTVKHNFTAATGIHPSGIPVIYNNKLYGTAASGGSNDAGVLYEYDLVTNTYAVKVTFGGSFGKWPSSALTLHNGKMYGTASSGGAHGLGTLFEYAPAGNSFIKRFDFSSEDGQNPTSTIVVFNNKLYGTTNYAGGTGSDGVLYEYNLATNTYTEKHNFSLPGGIYPNGNLTLHNNKLYGTTSTGGSHSTLGGTLYEYDPVLNTYSEPTTFTSANGYKPGFTQLTVVPALIAPGTPGSCSNIAATPITAANASQWVPFTDEGGNAVAEINANGNVLGNVTVQLYTHNGATRQDESGRFYLDRNITITVDNQPVTPVSVRFYIRKTEFESLKNTAGSGILNVSDITVFKNSQACSNSVGIKASPLTSSVSIWGLDYVYTTQVNSFSTFYFASEAYAALPVKLEYFKGVAEATVNRLHWKASCTENTDFIVERSTDGIHFSQAGMVLATVADCGQPFQFPDQHPVNGKAWYRLQMKESNGAVTYSSIIMLERGQGASLNVQLTPNPVAGPNAIFTIYSPGNKTIPVAIYDATGRVVARTQWQVQPGSQVRSVDVQRVPAGFYHAVWYEGNESRSIRFVRQ